MSRHVNQRHTYIYKYTLTRYHVKEQWTTHGTTRRMTVAEREDCRDDDRFHRGTSLELLVTAYIWKRSFVDHEESKLLSLVTCGSIANY